MDDVAPWCYKWVGGLVWVPFGANKKKEKVVGEVKEKYRLECMSCTLLCQINDGTSRVGGEKYWRNPAEIQVGKPKGKYRLELMFNEI